MNNSGVIGSSSLTVRESLFYAGHLGGFKHRQHLLTRLDSLLLVFRLKEKQHRLVRELSIGEQKKTLMAMELMVPGNGDIYFDEPLENLDCHT